MISPEDKRAFQARFLEQRPPHVRFSPEIREAFANDLGPLDHVELMMSTMEAHPFWPFEEITFGSDVLDFRRGLAYEIVLRQLAHTRSLTVNTNARNRPGMGTALRCMLEMYAFSDYVAAEKRIGDRNLLEKLYQGRAFTPGGWYDIEKEWEREHAEPLPQNTKNLLKSLLNLPRVGEITKPLHDADKGAGYVYSLYSEFVHPAFSRPRFDIESEFGEEGAFGTHRYYMALLNRREPDKLLKSDVAVGSFCLELFWPKVLEIDPYFDERCRLDVIEQLKRQGIDHPPD